MARLRGPAAPPPTSLDDDDPAETKGTPFSTPSATGTTAPGTSDIPKFDLLLKQTLAGDLESKDALLTLIKGRKVQPDVLLEWGKNLFLIAQFYAIPDSDAIAAERKSILDSLSWHDPLSNEQIQICYFVVVSLLPLLPSHESVELKKDLHNEADHLFNSWNENYKTNYNCGIICAIISRLLWLNNTPEIKRSDGRNFRGAFEAAALAWNFTPPTSIRYQLLIDLDELWKSNLVPNEVIQLLLKDPLLSPSRLYAQIEKIPDKHFPLLIGMISPAEKMRCLMGFFEVCLQEPFFRTSILPLTEPKKGFLSNLFAATPATKWIWLLRNPGDGINKFFDQWIKNQVEKYGDDSLMLNKLLSLINAFLKILTVKLDEPAHISLLRLQCEAVKGEIFLKLRNTDGAKNIFNNILPKDYNNLPSWLLMSVAHQLMQLSDPKETKQTDPPRVLLALIIVIKRGESDSEASYAKTLCIKLLKDNLSKGGWADKKSEKTYEELLSSYYKKHPKDKKFIEDVLNSVDQPASVLKMERR